jgi:guanylate kinase
MPAQSTGRLVILSGPSCVGKTPLKVALAKFHPELSSRLQPVVLFNSREPRPVERDGIDYHFRQRSHIEALRSSGHHIVLDVRGDLQALDIQGLTAQLARGDALFEGNTFVGRTLQTHPLLTTVEHLSIFLSPLGKDEIADLKHSARNIQLSEFVTDVMRRKLLRRTRRQKGELSLADLENIETRARSAYRELRDAWHFQHVIPNHDGEDSEHWDGFYYPIGDARKALQAVAALLEGESPAASERWEAALLSGEQQHPDDE